MKVIRISQVAQKTGLSRASIYRRLRDGSNFPHPFSLGQNSRGFDEAEIDQWLESLKAIRDAKNQASK